MFGEIDIWCKNSYNDEDHDDDDDDDDDELFFRNGCLVKGIKP